MNPAVGRSAKYGCLCARTQQQRRRETWCGRRESRNGSYWVYGGNPRMPVLPLSDEKKAIESCP